MWKYLLKNKRRLLEEAAPRCCNTVNYFVKNDIISKSSWL